MDPALAGVMSAVRTSDIRDVARRSIQGADVQLPADVIKRLQSAGPPKPCIDWPLYVFDFAPGKGVVQLQALLADGTVGKTGSFDIAVRPVYAGAFSLGAMHTRLAKPTFGLIKQGADSVIVERSGGPRVLYTVLYTYFIAGLRDVMDGALSVNPSVGVTLTDVGKNALAGITLDGGAAFFLTYGVHAGEVSELQPQSGLQVGSTFAGPSGDIPTRTHWKAEQFIAITVDIRAALGLLRAALGTAATGGG
jgi:hypothetical protein